MKSPDSPPTLEDVARRAGVSYQTVSRVVNNMPNVAPHTLEKVRQAIEELNYRPNRAARSLVTGKSHAVHILLCDKYNVRLVPMVEEATYQAGYQLRIAALHETHSAPELRQKLAEIVSSQVDGLLLVMPWLGIPYRELLQMVGNLPLVVVGTSMGAETNSTLIDQAHGTRIALQHLIDLGHRQIAEITGSIGLYEDSRIRHETYLHVLRQNGLTPGPSENGNFTMDSGFMAMNRLLSSGQTFTAVFCANDETALGAMHAAHQAGLKIPHDISMIGFDDEPFAKHCLPPLTTIQQDYRALGTNAVQHLLSLIENPRSAPHQRILFPKLIVRESTAPPPSK
ncbi:MAG: LacI family DNA-binding transcriptional regulator [Anaerolineales bacterium]